MPDSENIDAGLESYLRSDVTLQALCPGGVYLGAAPQNVSHPFIVWFLQTSADDRTHDRGGYETALYEVKAVGQGTEAATVAAASRRLRALLEGASWPVDGYTIVRCEREQRIAYVELDGDRRWQHRGALWDVWAAPAA